MVRRLILSSTGASILLLAAGSPALWAAEGVGLHWVAPGTSVASPAAPAAPPVGPAVDFAAVVNRLAGLSAPLAPSVAALPAAPTATALPAPGTALPFSLAPTEVAVAPRETEPVPEGIDLTALRYYAAQNDIARLSAEIRRIRALHPDWTPPDTVFLPKGPAVDEQPMWNLYGEGRLEEVVRLIEAERARTPGYTPSDLLTSALKEAEARRAIDRAANASAWQDVLTVAGANPALLVCRNMNVLWHVAHAFAETNQVVRALEVYAYILVNCEDPAERVATVQKASARLPDQALTPLFALARPRADGTGEFDTVIADRIRRKVGESMGKNPALQPTAEELARLETIAASGSIEDGMLLGWYGYSVGDYEGALGWFDGVLHREFRTKAVEGVVLSLRALNRLGEAKRIALEYAGEDALIAKLYIEIFSSELTDENPAPFPESEIEVLETVVRQERSALGAQSLGWYLYNTARPQEARDWFAQSVEWNVSPEGLLGLAIAENKIGNRKAARELAKTYGDRYPTLVAFVDDIGPEPNPARRTARPRQNGGGGGSPAAASPRRPRADPAMREALQAYEKGDYKTALARLDARRAERGETRDLATLRGWALHNSGRHKEAHRLFTQLNKEQSTKQTREGMLHTWRKMMPRNFH